MRGLRRKWRNLVINKIGSLKTYWRCYFRFAQFQAAANQGDITSQYWLGYLYQHGIGTTQDYAQALHWYRLSATRGDHISAPAMLALGKMYANGLGVTTNPATAASWYSQAIAAGDETISRQARAEMLRLNTPQNAK